MRRTVNYAAMCGARVALAARLHFLWGQNCVCVRRLVDCSSPVKLRYIELQFAGSLCGCVTWSLTLRENNKPGCFTIWC